MGSPRLSGGGSLHQAHRGAALHLGDDRATPRQLDPEKARRSKSRGGRGSRLAALTKFERRIGHSADCGRTPATREWSFLFTSAAEAWRKGDAEPQGFQASRN